MGKLGSFLKWSMLAGAVLAALAAVGLMHLRDSPESRRWLFAKVWSMEKSLVSPVIRKLECDMLQPPNVGGRVLEIGAGTGASLRCYRNFSEPNPITEWIAVEPNHNMHESLKTTIGSDNPFPCRILGSGAENLHGIEDNSIDTVVSIHVLCSVGEQHKVLREIARVLKPGGKFVFFEHVAAEHHTTLRKIQHIVQPLWSLLGDGCEFRDLEDGVKSLVKDAESSKGLYGLRLQSFENFEAPLDPFFVKPHIRGVIVKEPARSVA